ncbi:M14-type cytosolic carboxypeptidase [Parashewanella spongiae]|nr:M14-type cytosolic carboxypeptidase [Parashewanella spongiae]MCL1076766.1 M14-type cytosolic carboxypeptidase [Parashewanella spongiae]
MACQLESDIQLLANFPSANLGKVSQLQVSKNSSQIVLDNDNGDNSLYQIPKWRNWWNIKLEGLPIDRLYQFVVNDIFDKTNRGWEYRYTPLFSYDNKSWHRFESDEITHSSVLNALGMVNHQVKIERQYDKKQVFIARFYPYTQTDFDHFYTLLMKEYPELEGEGYFKKQTLGFSPMHHLPIDMITVTNPYIDANNKKSVWIQARSHAAETGGSFVTEGILSWLADRGRVDVNKALDNFIFYIVPMHNVDGVYTGNYRLNSKSENLENTWYRSQSNPLYLDDDSPLENQIINKKLRELSQSSAPFSIALNLHSTQSKPNTRAFFFPHFGTMQQGYSERQANLWHNSIRFIRAVSQEYSNEFGDRLIEPTPVEGGSKFASQNFPESWWWANFGDQVMAVTLETTYEHAGFQPGFITPDRLRALGESLMKGVLKYHSLSHGGLIQLLNSEHLSSSEKFVIPSEIDTKN